MKRFFKSLATWFSESFKGFSRNKCAMHAAGLTYFSVLAVVPVLCLLLLAARVCGAGDYVRGQINDRIDEMIANVEKGQQDGLASFVSADETERERKCMVAESFGRRARDISNAIFERIDKFDFATLGWAGLGFLLWTLISSFGRVETSFNEIWGVAKMRPLWKRALLYVFVALILPALAGSAMSLSVLKIVKDVAVYATGSASALKWMSGTLAALLDMKVVRLAAALSLSALALAFVFYVMPNRKLRFSCAWYGGLVTAVALGCWFRLCAVAQVGISRSSALYGSFALFPIVLTWMYMSWQIILFGACTVRAFDLVVPKKSE